MNALLGGKNSGHGGGGGGGGGGGFGNLANKFLGGQHGGDGGGGKSTAGKLMGQLASNLLSPSNKPEQPQNYHGGQTSGNSSQHQGGGLAGAVFGGVANMFGGKPSHGSSVSHPLPPCIRAREADQAPRARTMATQTPAPGDHTRAKHPHTTRPDRAIHPRATHRPRRNRTKAITSLFLRLRPAAPTQSRPIASLRMVSPMEGINTEETADTRIRRRATAVLHPVARARRTARPIRATRAATAKHLPEDTTKARPGVTVRDPRAGTANRTRQHRVATSSTAATTNGPTTGAGTDGTAHEVHDGAGHVVVRLLFFWLQDSQLFWMNAAAAAPEIGQTWLCK